MGRTLIISPIENPDVLNPAISYGSAFSRGTKVEVEDSTIGTYRLYFISGTASVNEEGKSVHIGDLSKQIERMQTNIREELRSAGGCFRDIVISTTYVRLNEFQKARDIVMKFEEYDKGGESIWIPSYICRENLLIEADVLAVQPRDFHDDLASIIQAYERNLLKTMKGLNLRKSCEEIPIGDLCYLFIFDYAESPEGNRHVPSKLFQNRLRFLYEKVTGQLEVHGVSWKDVVNTRINLPQLLANPPNLKEENALYYNLFNNVRGDLFKREGVKPYPSSTCVGTEVVPEKFLVGMSVLAVYEQKRI